MNWNHRVVKRTYEDEEWYAVHEIYYDGDKPWGITTEPSAPGGETIEELKEELDRFRKALNKPVLNYEDF